MSWFFALFSGLIQGITEFLPVSSSGHLVIFQQFFGMQDVEQDYMLFDVLLHFGTLLAVCVAYWPDIRDMVRALFNRVPETHGDKHSPTNRSARRLVLLLITATLPLVLVLFIKDMVEGLFSSTLFVGIALMLTGLVIFLSDRAAKGDKNERSATMTDALLIGLAQLAAVVPGLSRSGMTISAGLGRRLDRGFAVKFSFLLSLPAVVGANILSLIEAVSVGVTPALIPAYCIGVAAAAVSGYLAIRFMRYIVQKGKFGGFAYYCFGIGALTLLLTIF